MASKVPLNISKILFAFSHSFIWEQHIVLIFSHRGYHRKYKENTMDAFGSSLNYMVDGIETDIRKTADNVPILFHDRLTPCLQLVSDLTLKELNNAVGYSVPALSEAIAQWDQIIWNFEIKTPDAVESTIKILHRYTKSHRIIVTSFFHDILPIFTNSLGIECGAIIAHRSLNLGQLLNQLHDLDEHINNIVLPIEFVSEDTISIAHGQGFKIFVYDVEVPDDFSKCKNFMADAIITNRPDLAPSLSPSS